MAGLAVHEKSTGDASAAGGGDQGDEEDDEEDDEGQLFALSCGMKQLTHLRAGSDDGAADKPKKSMCRNCAIR